MNNKHKASNKSIKINYLYNIAFNLLTIIIPIISTPYVSRVLGADGLGIYNYTAAVTSFFIIISNLGTEMYAKREIAFNDDNINERSNIFVDILFIRIVASLILSVLYIIIILLDQKYALIYIVQYGLILANAINIAWLYQGLEDFKTTVVKNIIIKLITILSIFIFVKTKEDLVLYILINSIAQIVNSLVLWKNVKKIVIYKKIDLKRIRNRFKPIIVLFVPVASMYLYTYVDKIILGFLSNESEVGIYSQSETIVKLITTIITSLGIVLLPRISKLVGKQNIDEIRKKIIDSIKFVLFLGLPMTFGLIFCADLIVPWFLGNDFTKSSLLIKILSPLLLIIGLSSVTGQAVLVPMNKQKEYIISIVIGALINITINFILIPRFDSVGASVGTIIAELTVCTIQQIIVFKILRLSILEIIKSSYKFFISASIMALVLLLLKNQFSSNIIDSLLYILVGIITYFSLLLITGDYYLKKIISSIYHRKNI